MNLPNRSVSGSGLRPDGRTASRTGSSHALGALILSMFLAVMVCGSPVWSQTVQNPRRIADGPGGELLVSDRRSDAIVAVYKDTLEPAWSFQLPDEGAPFGLATLKHLAFVGNTKTKNVEVYKIKGSSAKEKLEFQYNLGDTPPGQEGSIANPISIAVNRKAKLVVVLDGGPKQVSIFDWKGTLIDAFSPTDGAGQLLSPVAVATNDVRQEILVADYGDPSGFFRARKPARILIYDHFGQLLFQIDGNGTTHETTQFTRVQGLATSADGLRIFATDCLGGRILVLDRMTGALLAEIGAPGPEPDQLMLPLDVFLDEKTEDLFVANNRGARRVEVFRGAGRSQ